jgi:hypothetical protein
MLQRWNPLGITTLERGNEVGGCMVTFSPLVPMLQRWNPLGITTLERGNEVGAERLL